jgi:chemotaxis signal transduction protein
MRVADLGETLGLGPAPDSAALNIVVCRAGAGAAGLIVEAIEDIVEEAVDLRRSRQHRGLAGAGVVRGQVTDFVDLAEVAALSGIRTEEAA